MNIYGSAYGNGVRAVQQLPIKQGLGIIGSALTSLFVSGNVLISFLHAIEKVNNSMQQEIVNLFFIDE